MENEVSQLVDKLNELIDNDDADTAWNIQDEISRVWKSLPPYSEGRKKLAEVWEKMMNKWQ